MVNREPYHKKKKNMFLYMIFKGLSIKAVLLYYTTLCWHDISVYVCVYVCMYDHPKRKENRLNSSQLSNNDRV